MTLPNFDQRGDWHYPVCRRLTSVTVALLGTSAEVDVENMNMCITQIHFTVPALDLGDTAGLALLDADDNVIYTVAEKAMSTAHVLDVHESVCDTITFEVTCSNPQNDAACTFPITVYGI